MRSSYSYNNARISSLELLRIIAMFLIVQSHFAVHGYMTMVDGDLCSIVNSLNRFVITAMTTGNIGNGLFMLITGYFMSLSSDFKINRLLKVVIQVLTYSVLCYVCYVLCVESNNVFLIKDVFTAITPLIHNTYWYFSSYVLILLFYPYINKLIKVLSQKELGVLICLMAIVWGGVPSILGLSFQSSGFLHFCIFYLIGAYIRKYYELGKGFEFNDGNFFLNGKCVKIFTIFSIFLWIVLAFLTSKFTPFYRMVYMGSPLVFLLTILVFIYFINLRVEHSCVINTIAGSVAGVYLLSDNPYVRTVLYSKIFHVERFVESNLMVFNILLYVVVVFIVCVIVEFIRNLVYQKSSKLLGNIGNIQLFNILK